MKRWVIGGIVLIILGGIFYFFWAQNNSQSTSELEVSKVATDTDELTQEVIQKDMITNTPTSLPPTATPKATSTPTATSTPIPTITPNIPSDDENLVYARAPQASTFTRPVPVFPSYLSFENQSNYDLKISIAEIGEIIPLSREASSRIQVAPGQYNYQVAWQQEGASVSRDSVSVSAGELVTITIKIEDISALAFENQSSLGIIVDLPDLDETFQVPAGTTSEERPLPPGQYTYVVRATDSTDTSLTGTADLEPRKVTTIVIEANAVVTSDLVVENNTDFELRLTLQGYPVSIIVLPRETSKPQPVPPGDYAYEVSAGGASNVGQVSITPNETTSLSFDLQTVIPDVGGLRFVNKTGSSISININGVAGSISLGPNETAPDKELPPGKYQFTVVASDNSFASYSSEADVEKGFVQEISLILTGSRARVTVVNRTSCNLSITFSGPETHSATIPSNNRQTFNLQEGNYSYRVQACNASASYNEFFSGSSEIEFSLR